MLTLGDQLKAAREAKRATASEAAAATRMKVQHIEALESNDYSRVAAPTYAKGFLRLYAEYLELDPVPLIRLYEQNHMPRTRAPILDGEPQKPLVERTEPESPAREPIDWSALRERAGALLGKTGALLGPARPYAPWALGGLAVLVLLVLSLRTCQPADREPPAPKPAAIDAPAATDAPRPAPAYTGSLIEEAPPPYLDEYLK